MLLLSRRNDEVQSREREQIKNRRKKDRRKEEREGERERYTLFFFC